MAKVHVGRTLLLGLLCWLLAEAGALLSGRGAKLDPPWRDLLAPAVALVVVLLTTFVQAAISVHRNGPGEDPRTSTPSGPSGRRSRGIPWIAAIAVLALFIGAGGWLASFGIRTLAPRVGISGLLTPTPSADATERLVAARAARSGPLGVRVTDVRQDGRTVWLRVKVHSDASSTLTLPLFDNCVLRADGRAVEADAFSRDWVDSVTPGATQSGWIVFAGEVPEGRQTVSLAFGVVYGSFDVSSITVKDIQLR